MHRNQQDLQTAQQTASMDEILLTAPEEIEFLREQVEFLRELVDSQKLHLHHKEQELQEVKQELQATNREFCNAFSLDGISP